MELFITKISVTLKNTILSILRIVIKLPIFHLRLEQSDGLRVSGCVQNRVTPFPQLFKQVVLSINYTAILQFTANVLLSH